MTGEIVGAYCLSEPGSGSDALGAKATAVTTGGRQLRPQRREDVDHQRRFRRPLHRVRQGRGSGRRTLLRLHRRARLRRRHERQGRAQDGPARLVDDTCPAAGRPCAGGQSARRGRQGTQGRVQRPELRPLQARRDVRRRREDRDRRGGAVCRRAQTVRTADRVVWRHQGQARRDDRADLRDRKPDLPNRRHDRRADRAGDDRPHGCGCRAHSARGIRHRGVDRQGRRQRSAERRARRKHPDTRRERFRSRLPGRASLPGRARQSHLRRHERNQPAARGRHARASARRRATCPSSPPPGRCRTNCLDRCRWPNSTALRLRTNGGPSGRSKRPR